MRGGFSLGAIFNLAALLIATVALLYWSRSRSKLPILVWAPYLIIAAGSLTYTTEVGDSARLLMSTLTFPAIFLSAFILLRTIEDVANLLLCIIYSSIVPTVVAFYQIATGGLGGMTGDRLQSTFSHPNVFAFYVIAVICAILYYNLVAHRHVTAIWRAFLFSYIPVLLAFLLITQTRSAWLGMAAFIVIYAIGVDRKLLVALPCAPLVLMLPVVSQRFEGIGAEPTITFEDVQSGYVVANSYGWRQLLWGRALEDSADARVLGKGLGTLGKNALHFFPLSEHATEAHSAYVQTIYELGILGLLAYLMLYLGIIGAVFIYRRRAPVWPTSSSASGSSISLSATQIIFPIICHTTGTFGRYSARISRYGLAFSNRHRDGFRHLPKCHLPLQQQLSQDRRWFQQHLANLFVAEPQRKPHEFPVSRPVKRRHQAGHRISDLGDRCPGLHQPGLLPRSVAQGQHAGISDSRRHG